MNKKIESIKNITKGKYGNLISFVLSFLIAFSFYQIIGIALDTDVPIVAVKSNSMKPTFYKGDMLIIRGSDNLNIGDIIVYSSKLHSNHIVHRIIMKNQDGMITKGDYNHKQDPWIVKNENVKGKVLFSIPLLGWPKVALSDAIKFIKKI